MYSCSLFHQIVFRNAFVIVRACDLICNWILDYSHYLLFPARGRHWDHAAIADVTLRIIFQLKIKRRFNGSPFSRPLLHPLRIVEEELDDIQIANNETKPIFWFNLPGLLLVVLFTDTHIHRLTHPPNTINCSSPFIMAGRLLPLSFSDIWQSAAMKETTRSSSHNLAR